MSGKGSKRALITGITGMVGSHLAEYIFDNSDWEIIGMIRWRSPLCNLERMVPEVNKEGRIRFVYADLRDTLAVSKAVRDARPDYVFHLGAQSYPLTSFDSPLDTLDTNVQGTVRLLEAVREHAPEALVHVCSSSEVYGKIGKEHLPIKEGAPFHPASPYAMSKIGTDLAGRYYAEAYGMKVMVTRMFTHTGPRRGDVFAEATFGKQVAMIEAGLIPPVVKVGNLKSVRTIADVRDAVRAYHMLLTVKPIPGECYNIGGSHSCSVGEVLEELIRLSTRSSEIKVEEDPARMRPIDADLQVPDTSKFTEHTGWRPEIPFEKTMADLLEYWRGEVKKGSALLTR